MTAPAIPRARRLLDALPPPGADPTIDEVAERSGLSRRRVSDAVAVLVRQGLAVRSEIGRLRLTEAGELARAEGRRRAAGPSAPAGPGDPRPAGLRTRVWRALRMLRKASLPELLEIAATDAETAATGRTANNAGRYLAALAAAGVVTVMPDRDPGTAPTSNGFKRYLLVEDLGPLTPVFNGRAGTLRDPNQDRLIWSRTDGRIA